MEAAKKYSLAICRNNPIEYEIVPWTEFEQIMRRDKVSEAILFIIDDDANEVSLARRYIIGDLILKNDGLDHYDEYCLIDHQNGDRLYPCTVLLNPEIHYAITKAVEFRENESIIQCVIFRADDTFNVKEYELVRFDNRFNSQVN